MADFECKICNETDIEERYTECECCKTPIDTYCLFTYLIDVKLDASLPHEKEIIDELRIGINHSNILDEYNEEIIKKLGFCADSRDDYIFSSKYCPVCNGDKTTDSIVNGVLTKIHGYTTDQAIKLVKELLKSGAITFERGNIIKVDIEHKDDKFTPLIDIMANQRRIIQKLEKENTELLFKDVRAESKRRKGVVKDED